MTTGRRGGADAGVDFVFELFGVFLDDAEAAFDGVVGCAWDGLMRAGVRMEKGGGDGGEGGW